MTEGIQNEFQKTKILQSVNNAQNDLRAAQALAPREVPKIDEIKSILNHFLV